MTLVVSHSEMALSFVVVVVMMMVSRGVHRMVPLAKNGMLWMMWARRVPCGELEGAKTSKLSYKNQKEKIQKMSREYEVHNKIMAIQFYLYAISRGTFY